MSHSPFNFAFIYSYTLETPCFSGNQESDSELNENKVDSYVQSQSCSCRDRNWNYSTINVNFSSEVNNLI